MRRKGRTTALKANLKDGYPRVALQRHGESKLAFVHHLAALAFLGPSGLADPVVDHINDHRDDNRVENLRWVSRSVNRRESSKARARIGRPIYKASSMIAGEEWRSVAVEGVSWPYEVSSEGNVRRIGKSGNLRQSVPKGGYPYVGLCMGGRTRTFKVHTLVANAFLPARRDPQWVVNHKNGVKSDNRAANLEWVSLRENARHARSTGLRSQESGHVLSLEEVEEIRRHYSEGGITQNALADRFRVCQSTVSKVIRGERYSFAAGPTETDNREKMGKHSRGEDHPSAKISEKQVVELRRLYHTGRYRQADLAAKFGLEQITVSNIVRGKSWQGAGGPIAEDQRTRLSDAEVREIRELDAAGSWSLRELAVRFSVDSSTVARILTGESRREAGGPITREGKTKAK